jgi:hypothetical protein
VVDDCSDDNAVWLYDASGRMICFVAPGQIDLSKYCRISAGLTCAASWAGAVSAVWPGQNAGALSSSSCSLSFSSWGAYESTGSCGASANLLTLYGNVYLSGRIASQDSYDCTGGTTSQNMPWSSCHVFKHHFDPAGAITSGSYVADAERPITGSLLLSNPSCLPTTASTDRDGFFSASATCWAPPTAFSGVLSLTTPITSSTGVALGTARAVWTHQDIAPVYSAPDTSILYTDSSGKQYQVPSFALSYTLGSAPGWGAAVNLGTAVLDANFASTSYLRGALAQWENIIELQYRMRDLFAQDHRLDLFQKTFETDLTRACVNCFTLNFTLPGAYGGGRGGAGGFATASPALGLTLTEVEALSAAGLTAHEYGHSVHATVSPATFFPDYTFADALRDPSGVNYSVVGHAPFDYQSSPQEQEMGTALVEGFGDAMARFLLLDGCNGVDSVYPGFPGTIDMLSNMWNPDGFSWCDGNGDTGCPYHNFRWHMVSRGIVENSAEWDRRYTALKNLATQASAVGMQHVLTNNEVRYRDFYCTLLAANPDYSSVAGMVLGQSYVEDFTFQVGEILDGRTPVTTVRQYGSDLTTNHPHVSFVQLLTSMGMLCPECNAYPTPNSVLPLWEISAMQDGANGAYDVTRLSISGDFSPQTLGMSLVNRGLISRDALNNGLRDNYMDEVPLVAAQLSSSLGFQYSLGGNPTLTQIPIISIQALNTGNCSSIQWVDGAVQNQSGTTLELVGLSHSSCTLATSIGFDPNLGTLFGLGTSGAGMLDALCAANHNTIDTYVPLTVYVYGWNGAHVDFGYARLNVHVVGTCH